jgi:methionine synthase I (cobalamin-dependent)/5,10-methylenetetrahydrofolate reductase
MSITGASVPAAELLSGERVLVCDGAMGTMLHAAGAALDRSLPELNLSDPDLVATIHDSYLSAGADIIQANTFGANRLWLGDHGFPDKVDEINRAGVRLARAACAQAGRPTLVAGSVSPAVTALQRRRVGSAERVEVLREQVLALITEGVDLLILETFGYLDELVEAVSVAASLTDVPLIAQATFADDARTLGGETPREVASVLSALPVAALGTNCTVGPQRMLAVAEDLVRYSSVPVSAQPNAGQPRRVGARTFEFSIDGGYFARYLGRFAAAGVTIVGGCCGTTPTHIRAAAEAVRTAELHASSSAGGVGFAGLGTGSSGGVSASSAGLTVSTGATDADAGSVTGAGVLAELLAAGSFVVAASITTPAGGWAGEAEEAAAVFQSRGIGLVAVQPRENARTHMDSLNMALQLQQRVGVETLPTVTSWDKSIMSLQADLLGAHALGIRSVVATTGSPSVFGDYPAVDGTWEVDSLGLAGLLAGLNAGRDSNGLALTSRTSFCIGARVNPGARDPEAEIARAHAKIRAGAQFLVSRPVYEPDSLRALVSALEGTGVPLLLSMTPLRSFEEADYLAHEVPGVTIPASVLESLEKAGRGAARSVGIALATDLLAQVRPLVRGVILTAPDDDATAILPLIDALR